MSNTFTTESNIAPYIQIMLSDLCNSEYKDFVTEILIMSYQYMLQYVALVTCQPGRYLLNGVCYAECPLMYYPANVTSLSVTTSLPATVIGVCSHCDSIGSCADLLRLLLTIAGIISCGVIVTALVVFACVRGVCHRPPTSTSIESIASLRLRGPRYITNGHIIAGLSTKPLLAATDSESSDESDETPSDSANVNNI